MNVTNILYLKQKHVTKHQPELQLGVFGSVVLKPASNFVLVIARKCLDQ